MSNVIDLFGVKRTIEELKEYAEAQFSVISRQNKEIEKLKLEKKHVEDLLKSTIPALPITKEEEEMLDEEKICKDQLRIFRNLSNDRELTIEETRKVEIYAKILLQLRNPQDKKKSSVEKLDTKELLKLVEMDDPKIS